MHTVPRAPESQRRSGFFPPEVLDDIRGVARLVLLRRRGVKDVTDERRGLVWLWLLLLIYPFTDYLSYSPLTDAGVNHTLAAAAFVVLDTGVIVAALLSRGDAAGARFFGVLVGVIDITYAATQLLRDGTVAEELVFNVLYTVMLAWVLAHIFRREPIGRLLTAPIVIGGFVAYNAYTIPGLFSHTDLETLLKSADGVTYYNAAAAVIPVFLIALSFDGGWVTDVEGDSPLAHTLRHGLRLVTILILAIAQAAAISAMLGGGGSVLAYQITVEAMAIGFTAIFIMLQSQGRHEED